MAFKMKGSPMEKNFGISPVKQTDPFEKLYKKVNPKDPKAIEGKHYPSSKTTKKLQKGPYAKGGQNASTTKPKKPTYPKNFNSTGSSKAGKLAKVGKFLGGKLTGVLGLLGAGTLNASASNVSKKSEGEQIKNLLTKHKLKGGKN